MEVEEEDEMAVSLKSRITLAIVVVTAPLFVWAGRMQAQIEDLQRDRTEIRQDLKEIKHKVDDIRDRLPLAR